MKRIALLLNFLAIALVTQAQTNPAITSWLQNTTITGTYYVVNNSTAIDNNILVNCQEVSYSNDFAYIRTRGIPAYPTGPFQDGNPSQASDQNAIFQIPLSPQENTGTPTATRPGNIGIFINGVALFDYRDGVAWNPNTNALCGGPGNPSCPGGPGNPQDWNRDAIPAEMDGFDCSKAHPAMGNYHHHQNPSAFDMDINVLSDVCDMYSAEGLYAIDANAHSPLIGFAYDGFPIYGAYGYQNADGTGGIIRIKSGYSLRNITSRTHHADGTNVDDGPVVSTTYPLGYFREDYEYIANPADDYLDEHNGRFCSTPEYPDGTYAYFATVDENWNSAYPYVVGPTFYGVYANRSANSVPAGTTIYTPAVLPITQIDFQATLKEKAVVLTWITATEINNDFFTLERSADGLKFEKIATIDGAGNTAQKQFYQYEDAAYLSEVSYYRLQQTDFDGTVTYSKTVSVQAKESLVDAITIFPNPSSDFVIVQVKGLVRQEVEVNLFNLEGQLMKTQKIQPGTTMNYLDIQTLYNGEYILQVSDGLKISTHQISVFH